MLLGYQCGLFTFNDMRIFIFILALTALTFSSCDREIETNPVTQREISYDKAFEDYIGSVAGNQCWGDWKLNINSKTRSVSVEETDFKKYMDIDYPSSNEIIDAVNIMHEYYDGINLINIPPGDYWVTTIYKNDYVTYTDLWFFISWFKAYEKMSKINVYDYEKRKYINIENIDSLTLVKGIEEYDGVIPQFSYFNELYSENYFDYRTIEKFGVYYIGFDFYIDGFMNNSLNETHGKDCIYDDWVIMLIPAIKYGQETVIDEKRIMCEDLSLNPDFDFNDLVFDVAIVNIKDSLKTRITLQAVGTKTSISFFGKDAHSYFGLNQGVCINTGGKEGQTRKEPVMFYLDELLTDLTKIEAYVFYENKLYELDAPIGKPTKKICVDCSTKWSCGELGIWLPYPSFKEYVRGEKVDWEKNVRTELVFNQTY